MVYAAVMAVVVLLLRSPYLGKSQNLMIDLIWVFDVNKSLLCTLVRCLFRSFEHEMVELWSTCLLCLLSQGRDAKLVMHSPHDLFHTFDYFLTGTEVELDFFGLWSHEFE